MKKERIRSTKKIEMHCTLILIIWFTLFFLTGCGDKKELSDYKNKGTLYFGVESAFHGLDVMETSGMLIPSMAAVNNLIQEKLFRMDADGSLIPVLGLSALSSADGRSWDITLRQGVVFHDGTPFNADAVIKHWCRMLTPTSGYKGRRLFEPIIKVEKIEVYKVRFF